MALRGLCVLLGCLALSLGEPVVDSPIGRITGTSDTIEGIQVDSFRGIPYAKPPVGDLRFAHPVPFGSVGDFQATKFSSICPQPEFKLFAGPPLTQSEDCLFLNVARKAGTAQGDDKAVIVLIHGGAFSLGSAGDFSYDGVPLAALGDVVVVGMNYRLGVMGFADMKDLAPGNLGFYDQRLAMEWVQQNIRAFGGNPDRVTLMGVSAGAMSVSAQINTPLNRGKNLFHAAIMDAGVMAPGIALSSDHSLNRMKHIASKLGCQTDDGKEMLSCLRSADAINLTAASFDTEYSPLFTLQPTVDGKFVPHEVAEDLRDNAKDYIKVKTIVGVAKDEGTFFAGYDIGKTTVPVENADEFLKYLEKIAFAYKYPIDVKNPELRPKIVDAYYEKYASRFHDVAEFMKDGTFVCPTNAFVKSYTKHTNNVYVYYFERKLQVGFPPLDPAVMGAFHGSPYFHMAAAFMRLASLMPNAPPVNELDKQFYLDSLKLVADFAKSDDTPTFRGVKWPDFATEKSVLVFNEKPSVRDSLVNEPHCQSVFPVYEGLESDKRAEL